MSFDIRRLGQRHLVFNETHQAIYEVDEAAAYVGRSLNAGMSFSEITHELIETGLGPDRADKTVSVAFQALQSLVRCPSSSSAAVPETGNFLSDVTVAIADVAIGLNLSSDLVEDVCETFDQLIVTSRKATCLVHARTLGENIIFSTPSRPDWCCERSQFIPLLKAQLIEFAIEFAGYEVALHAAALAREDKAVLLVGSPGAGKTTLAIALAKAGLELLADDVSLLHSDGTITGIALPYSAKASSWPLLSRLWPGMTDRPSHCRPDGEILCYIPQDRTADPRPRRVGALIFLDRRGCADTLLADLDQVEALTALMAEGVTRDELLHSSGFAALVEAVGHARCCRLTYSDLREGARAIVGLKL